MRLILIYNKILLECFLPRKPPMTINLLILGGSLLLILGSAWWVLRG
jgi:hypothetical protein